MPKKPSKPTASNDLKLLKLENFILQQEVTAWRHSRFWLTEFANLVESIVTRSQPIEISPQEASQLQVLVEASRSYPERVKERFSGEMPDADVKFTTDVITSALDDASDWLIYRELTGPNRGRLLEKIKAGKEVEPSFN